MADPWQILRAGGLPLAMPRAATKPTATQLAEATTAAIASAPAGRDADALAAFILAWEQHWPTSYRSALGEEAARVSAWAVAQARDENRYLKLRRIAVENLASVL